MKHYSFIFVSLFLLTFCTFTFAQADIEGLLKKSAEYEQQDKLNEAVGELTKAIAIEPDNADLYLRRSEINRFLNQNESLATDVKKAVGLNPNDKIVVLRASNSLRNANQCAESLNILNDYIFNNAESGDVFSARSHSQMCLGDWISAYQDMSKASELNPENNLYRTNQAGLLAQLGNSAEAAEKFNRLIKGQEVKLAKVRNKGEKESIKRILGEIYRTRAGVNHSKSDTSAELADLAKFIEYNPKDFSYRIRAKIYRDHKMYTEAIADYSEANRLSPTEPIFLLERGDVFVEMGKYEEAIGDYGQSLKLDTKLKDIVEQRIAHIKIHSKDIKN